MLLSVFDLIGRMLGFGWNLLSWLLDLSVRFFGAVLDFSMRAVGAVCRVFLTPFSWAAGRFWDGDLRSIFGLLMWVLLGACVFLALLALGENAYRRFRRR